MFCFLEGFKPDVRKVNEKSPVSCEGLRRTFDKFCPGTLEKSVPLCEMNLDLYSQLVGETVVPIYNLISNILHGNEEIFFQKV